MEHHVGVDHHVEELHAFVNYALRASLCLLFLMPWFWNGAISSWSPLQPSLSIVIPTFVTVKRFGSKVYHVVFWGSRTWLSVFFLLNTRDSLVVSFLLNNISWRNLCRIMNKVANLFDRVFVKFIDVWIFRKDCCGIESFCVFQVAIIF